MNLSILYRGSLASCNYGCFYCPFAKHRESLAEHRADQAELERFIAWVSQQTSHQISILFTPWGEALLHGRYQRAFITLTNLPNVRKVAIQTNLSGRLEWVKKCQLEKIGIWATYHPLETSRTHFLAQCQSLNELGVRYSVGIVGIKEHWEEIRALREHLPENVYLWVNAYKREANYYSPDELITFEAIDPLFPFNNTHHPSFGKACRTGESVFSVNGVGEMRRCHFIKEAIGNIYDENWLEALQPRLCTNATCHCHIGYIHMNDLNLYEIFGEGILERIPAQPLRS